MQEYVVFLPQKSQICGFITHFFSQICGFNSQICGFIKIFEHPSKPCYDLLRTILIILNHNHIILVIIYHIIPLNDFRFLTEGS